MTTVLVEDTLLASAVDEYDAAHASVPADVLAAIEASRATRWRIWRDGTRLIQLIECDNWAVTSRILEERTPRSWADRMRVLVDPLAGPTRVSELRVVWSFK